MEKIPRKHRTTARAAMCAAGGCGPIGAFSTVADIASISTIWAACLGAVAADEGRKIDKDTALDVCKSALLGMGGYYAGCKAATKAFHLIPGAGTLIGMGISSVANVIFTYRFALTLCDIFEKKGKSLELENLANNIKTMFKGNGFSDFKDMGDILLNG